MYKIILAVFFTCIATMNTAHAQQSKTSGLYKYVIEKRQSVKTNEDISLFHESVTAVPALIKNVLTAQQLLDLDRSRSRILFQKKPFSILFTIPYNESSFQLELIKEDISMGGLKSGKLTDKGSRGKASIVKAVHYRGYIKNNPSSIASLSVFENGELMCLFSDAGGNWNLGSTAGGKYILFNGNDMKQKPHYECGTDETPANNTPANTNYNGEINSPLAQAPLCNKVRIYWEVNYNLYNQRFGSNYTNTVNYISGLFNQVAVMFLNEGIIAELSETYIWVTQDTFNTSNSGTGLAAIRNKWNSLGNSFNGDLCMLIDGGTSNNGGRAYLLSGGLCNRAFNYGYSNVYGNYNNVPAYSWDVEVVTHETGHNLGAHHTHWCGWNTGTGGTCGAIDDCYAVETTTGCNTCSAAIITNPGAPIGFSGTVMSYCHLRSGIGINLSNGFGPLPRAAIRSSINNSSCLIQDNKWSGAFDNAWENGGNWSCGSVPTINTDVTIPEGLINYPVVNSAAECRKLNQQENSAVNVQTGFSLRVAGTD